MDKKDIKGFIRMITKIYLIMVLGIGIPFIIIFGVISWIFNGHQNIIMNIVDFFKALLLLGCIIYGGIGIGYIFTLLKRKKESLSTDINVRDLPQYFPPAIASLLLDMSLETTTDYTATIAYLISKKYIELRDTEIFLINNNTSKLSAHERYALQCVMKEKKFNHQEFTKLVVSDAEKMGYIKSGKRKINFFRNFGLAFIITLICMILSEVIKLKFVNIIIETIGVIAYISVFVVIGYSLYLVKKYQNESFHRTLLGKKEAFRWAGVKNYLKNYTLISDRNLEDTILFDDYIPYAISLNEAKTIEKYIENNDTYRKLIYGNIYNFD